MSCEAHGVGSEAMQEISGHETCLQLNPAEIEIPLGVVLELQGADRSTGSLQ